VGYDAAEPVLAENRERANEGDVENVAFERAVLPAFDPDRKFDLVSSFVYRCERASSTASTNAAAEARTASQSSRSMAS